MGWNDWGKSTWQWRTMDFRVTTSRGPCEGVAFTAAPACPGLSQFSRAMAGAEVQVDVPRIYFRPRKIGAWP